MAAVKLWISDCFLRKSIVFDIADVIIMGFLSILCLILLALCNWPNHFRHPNTKTHWLCQHYWHHHWPALDPYELYYHYYLPDNGSSIRRKPAIFPRYGGSIIWLLHNSWFGARRGLWHQYLHCNRGGTKQADHIHKANTSWWFNSFTQSEGGAGL